MEPAEPGLEAEEAKRRIRNQWLLCGVVPVLAFFIMSAAAARFAHHATLSEVKAEDRFQGFLAIAAGLFLTAFWADGYLTNPERLLRRVVNPDEDVSDKTKQRKYRLDPGQRAIIRERVVRLASWMVHVGIAIGLVAVAASWHLPNGNPYYGLQVVAVATIYQLFVFSRHRFYFDLIDGKGLVVQPRKRRAADRGSASRARATSDVPAAGASQASSAARRPDGARSRKRRPDRD